MVEEEGDRRRTKMEKKENKSIRKLHEKSRTLEKLKTCFHKLHIKFLNMYMICNMYELYDLPFCLLVTNTINNIHIALNASAALTRNPPDCICCAY